METNEYPAGDGQWVVVYRHPDDGGEIDPDGLAATVAGDMAARSARGQRVVSTSTITLRHSAAFFAREGSGYVSSVALLVVYAAG
jgi:hypothetical protein